ncbi:MAG TPA: nucleotide disphospho-sugar-binding domain-containing protein [Pseudonocardiaceae bacterium]|nr:nucleotide disphospho-sugar-binding domain-containing protein [Pseudonocardiaceae bacterium]
MARFLIASQPITGHVLPAIPVVRALAGRGHEVWWYTGRRFSARAEAAGARFAGYEQAYDYDDRDYDAAFPGRGALTGLNQIRFDMRKLFIEQASKQHRDLTAILARFPADVVLGDPSMFAAVTVEETGGPPSAIYNVSCLGLAGREVAPFGLGLMPSATPLGILRNRVLAYLAPNVVFRQASQELARQCAEIGVAPRKFEGGVLSPNLFLQPTVEAFEYPRSDLPPQVHFIGALLLGRPAEFVMPSWWDELVLARRPVILVTQGTVATAPTELVAPTISGLLDDDVLVVAVGVRDPDALGLVSLAPNVRVERYIPFTPLMPFVDVYVTNGGFGGVQYALANGVPIVVAGTTEDKPEIGNRVAYAGAGINLRTSSPTPQRVADAVRTLLRDPRYRAGAEAIQAELSRHNAPVEAAELLERLAETKAPVLRSSALS